MSVLAWAGGLVVVVAAWLFVLYGLALVRCLRDEPRPTWRLLIRAPRFDERGVVAVKWQQRRDPDTGKWVDIPGTEDRLPSLSMSADRWRVMLEVGFLVEAQR